MIGDDLEFDENKSLEELGYEDLNKKKKKRKKKLTYADVNDSEIFNIEWTGNVRTGLNPFKSEDKVVLDIQAHKARYDLIMNLKPDTVGAISQVINSHYVNVSYWDTLPIVIKNVPAIHLTLTKDSNIFRRVISFFKKLIIKVIKPKVSEYTGRK